MSRLYALLQSIGRPAGALGLLALIVAGLFFLIAPDLTVIQPLLIAGVVLIVLFLLGALEELRLFLFGRATRYGTNEVLMVVAFVGIIALVNVLVVRNNQRLDLTEAQQFTLSAQTLQILANLKAPVHVVGFFSNDLKDIGLDRRAEDLLEEYTLRSDKFTYEFADPFTQPALVNKYNVQSDGSIVFASEGRTQIVSRSDEQTFTSAILKVTRAQQKKVYFLVGHGEREYNDFRDRGYGDVGQALHDDNYAVEPLNLVITTTVPDDTAVLVIPDPRKNLDRAEIQAIRTYLKEKGPALILTEPRTKVGLEEILADWYVVISDGMVVDAASALPGNPTVPVVQRYPISDITRDLPLSYFPVATAITTSVSFDEVITSTTFPDRGPRLEPLLMSTEQSWLETDPEKIEFNRETEVLGPLPFGVMVEMVNPPPAPGLSREVKRKLVAIGDTDFATNEHVKRFGNRDLFLNAVNWLAEEQELIAVRPKQQDVRAIFLNPVEQNFILISSVILLPLVVLVTGGIVWWRRR